MKNVFLLVLTFLFSILNVSAITVNVTNTNIVNYAPPTPNSFAWAIAQVNAAGAGTHTINIMVAGVLNDPQYAPYHITNNNVTIDGTQAPGYVCGTPTFFWQGPGYAPVTVSGTGGVFKGMGIAGIRLVVSGAGFKMFGCWYGLNTTGTGQFASVPGPEGISLTGGNARIGFSSSACGRNVFASQGVTNTMLVSGDNNFINGNYFNTPANGSTRLTTGVTGAVIVVSGNNNTLDSNVVLGSAGGGNFGGICINGASDAINIRRNHVGVNAAGTLSNGAAGYGNNGFGVFSLAAITGSSFITGNVISNNRQSGISLGGNVSGLTINDNIVGLPANGVQASTIYGNGDAGIRTLAVTVSNLLIHNNTVCNSGLINTGTNQSTNTGIIFNSSAVSSAVVSDNYTGVDRTFNLAGNQFPGIYFYDCGVMGGSNVANVRVINNVVGDNGQFTTTPSNGIAAAASSYFTIDNNFVGIGPGGQNIGNVSSGIELNSCTNFVVTNNNIQYNKGRRPPTVADACAGIITYQSTTGRIQGNVIANHSNAGVGFVNNNGIAIQQGGQILIGGTAAGQPNNINNNGTHGVFVFDGANNVQMTRNIITCNTSMGISLNVAGDPNTIASKGVGNTSMTSGPTLILAGCPGGGVVGSGNASGTSPGTNATIEVFATPPCKTCPNVLRGEAQSYQQTVTATGTTWTATGVSGNVSVTATNSVGSGGFFPTSRFSDCQTCSLPIVLLFFNGHYLGDDVLLNWATSSEKNNKLFTVERSSDGSSFYPIGVLDGAGNSSLTRNYSFTDEQPLVGISYYRLRQTDFDGEETYSNVITIVKEANSSMVLYPNPASDQVSVFMNQYDEIGLVSIKLYNTLGQEVYTSLVDGINLASGVSLDLSSLPQGSYVVKLLTAHGEWVERLVKD